MSSKTRVLLLQKRGWINIQPSRDFCNSLIPMRAESAIQAWVWTIYLGGDPRKQNNREGGEIGKEEKSVKGCCRAGLCHHRARGTVSLRTLWRTMKNASPRQFPSPHPLGWGEAGRPFHWLSHWFSPGGLNPLAFTDKSGERCSQRPSHFSRGECVSFLSLCNKLLQN